MTNLNIDLDYSIIRISPTPDDGASQSFRSGALLLNDNVQRTINNFTFVKNKIADLPSGTTDLSPVLAMIDALSGSLGTLTTTVTDQGMTLVQLSATVGGLTNLGTITLQIMDLMTLTNLHSEQIAPLAGNISANATNINNTLALTNENRLSLIALTLRVIANESNLTSANALAQGHTTLIGDLTTGQLANTNAITILTPEVTRLSTAITSLQNLTQSEANALSNLTVSVGNNRTSIVDLSNNISSNDLDIASLRADVNTNISDLALLTALTNSIDIDTIMTLETTVALHTTQLITIAGVANTVEIGLGNLTSTVSSNSNDITALQLLADNNRNKIDPLILRIDESGLNEIPALVTSVTSHTAMLIEHREDIDTVTSAARLNTLIRGSLLRVLTANITQITETNSLAVANTGALTTLGERVEVNMTAITALQSTVAGHTTTLSSVEGDTNNNTILINTNTTNIATNVSNITDLQTEFMTLTTSFIGERSFVTSLANEFVRTRDRILALEFADTSEQLSISNAIDAFTLRLDRNSADITANTTQIAANVSIIGLHTTAINVGIVTTDSHATLLASQELLIETLMAQVVALTARITALENA